MEFNPGVLGLLLYLLVSYFINNKKSVKNVIDLNEDLIINQKDDVDLKEELKPFDFKISSSKSDNLDKISTPINTTINDKSADYMSVSQEYLNKDSYLKIVEKENTIQNKKTRNHLIDYLSNKKNIQSAIIIKEIISKPLSLRTKNKIN